DHPFEEGLARASLHLDRAGSFEAGPPVGVGVGGRTRRLGAGPPFRIAIGFAVVEGGAVAPVGVEAPPPGAPRGPDRGPLPLAASIATTAIQLAFGSSASATRPASARPDAISTATSVVSPAATERGRVVVTASFTTTFSRPSPAATFSTMKRPGAVWRESLCS